MSDEVKTAIERAIGRGTNSEEQEVIADALKAFANEDAVVRMMASYNETQSAWNILSVGERYKRIDDMRAALLALARECGHE